MTNATWQRSPPAGESQPCDQAHGENPRRYKPDSATTHQGNTNRWNQQHQAAGEFDALDAFGQNIHRQVAGFAAGGFSIGYRIVSRSSS